VLFNIFIGTGSGSALHSADVESVHWNLDVTFKDDANKTRKDCAPENLAVAKKNRFKYGSK